MESDIEDIEKNLEKNHIYQWHQLSKNTIIINNIYPSKHALF